VDLLGGTIGVESKSGQGTSFTVELPLELTMPAAVTVPTGVEPLTAFPASFAGNKGGPDTQTAAAVTRDPGRDAALVLVIEDNPDLRTFISRSLSGQFRVLEAKDGQSGLTQAVETVPDLVISDIMMPELDGITLCQKLKTDPRTSHIPVILLTAKADTDSKLGGLGNGADDYLIKPFQLEELQLRIHNLIAQRQHLRHQYSRQLILEPQAITVLPVDERFLQKALSVVEAHLEDSAFDVETFGREIGMSRSHLHRKLTALTSQSPSEFIRTLRIKRAASLLRQQHGNVSEVALAVGFSSLNYFTKCFRDQYGQNPSEYARQESPVR
jgi:DNA-binding response OmpR family regulator